MPKINKVAHIVLSVQDPESSAEWYSKVLDMEVMVLNRERHMAFLSFGTQHHDIALFKAPEGEELSRRGLAHFAMQIDGGEEELRQLYGRFIDEGVHIRRITEHSTTRSIYFADPDGNELEIFCEKMSPEEGMRTIRESGGGAKPMDLEPIFTR